MCRDNNDGLKMPLHIHRGSFVQIFDGVITIRHIDHDYLEKMEVSENAFDQSVIGSIF